jgi:hypothetical protein
LPERNEPADESPADEQSGASSLPEPTQPDGPVDRLNPPKQREVEQQREDARLVFTVVMLLVFGLQLLVGGIAVFVGPESWGNAQDYLRITLPATVALLGSAIGFYFGSQR